MTSFWICSMPPSPASLAVWVKAGAEGATAQRREQSERPLRTPRARPSSKGHPADPKANRARARVGPLHPTRASDSERSHTPQRREQSERPLRTPRARPSSKGHPADPKARNERIGHGHGLAHSTPPARATASAPIPRSGASKASGLYARRERGNRPARI